MWKLLQRSVSLLWIGGTFLVAETGWSVDGFSLSRTREKVETALKTETGYAEVAVAQSRVTRAGSDRSVALSQFISGQVEGAAPDAIYSLNAFQTLSSASTYTARLLPEEGNNLPIWTLEGRYQEAVRVPVPARRIYKGDRFVAEDLTSGVVPKNALRQHTLLEESSLIGREAVRLLQPGKPVTVRDVRLPILVHKGETIEALYRRPYMTLKATVQVLEDGSGGDIIRVRNTKSNTILRARVEGDGSLCVNYSDDASPLQSEAALQTEGEQG